MVTSLLAKLNNVVYTPSQCLPSVPGCANLIGMQYLPAALLTLLVSQCHNIDL